MRSETLTGSDLWREHRLGGDGAQKGRAHRIGLACTANQVCPAHTHTLANTHIRTPITICTH